MTVITLIAAIVALLVAVISAGLVGYYGQRFARAISGVLGDAKERTARPVTPELPVGSARGLPTVETDQAGRAVSAAERTATAVAELVKLGNARRHTELTPQFRIACAPADDGRMNMTVTLAGPVALEQLSEMTVRIRDDQQARARARDLQGPGLPPESEIEAQVWGRWRHVPLIRPADGALGADEHGRASTALKLEVGESVTFPLEPVRHPSWRPWTPDRWRELIPPMVRLELKCRANGWDEVWTVPADLQVEENGHGSTEVP